MPYDNRYYRKYRIKRYWLKHINLAFSQYFSFFQNGLSEKSWLNYKRLVFDSIMEYHYPRPPLFTICTILSRYSRHSDFSFISRTWSSSLSPSSSKRSFLPLRSGNISSFSSPLPIVNYIKDIPQLIQIHIQRLE